MRATDAAADPPSRAMPILQVGGGGVFGRRGDPSGYVTARAGALLLKSRHQMWGLAAMMDRVGAGQWQLGAYGTLVSEVAVGAPLFLELGVQRRLGAEGGTFGRAQAGIAPFFFPLFIEAQRGLGSDEWVAVAGLRIDLALFGLFVHFVGTHGRRQAPLR